MILCVGTTPAVQRSMRFANVRIDGVNRTADVSQYASGKAVNAARVLRALGVRSLSTGFAGGDTGAFFLNDLQASGLAHEFVAVQSSTRMCITLMDQAQGTATELIEESHEVEATAYQALIDVVHKLLPQVNGMMLCGSLPPLAPADFYARCVAAAVNAGKPVLLDATGEPLRRSLAHHPTVIKPNRSELSQTVGAPVETNTDLKAAITQLLAMGPRWAVVTHGAKETVASDGVGFWRISTPRVAVVSPIGSGDSFAAGLMAGMVAGQTVPQACRLAAACGAANAKTSKAGHLQKAEVERLLAQIEISEF